MKIDSEPMLTERTQGEVIPASKEYRVPIYRIFAATRKTFVYEQELYISDTSTESHYKVTHKKNKGETSWFEDLLTLLTKNLRRRDSRHHKNRYD
jgi:hypothetical protein